MKPLGFTLEEMGLLLDLLTVLNDPDANPMTRATAQYFVNSCHGRAEESCHTLEKQLAYAVEFRNLLANRS